MGIQLKNATLNTIWYEPNYRFPSIHHFPYCQRSGVFRACFYAQFVPFCVENTSQ